MDEYIKAKGLLQRDNMLDLIGDPNLILLRVDRAVPQFSPRNT